MQNGIIGILSQAGFILPDGRQISNQEGVERGFQLPKTNNVDLHGVELEQGEHLLGRNLMVDNGRQFLAYLFGGMTPMANFSCSAFGIGTGTTAPKSSDTDLESPLLFYTPPAEDPQATKPIRRVSFPSPLVARVELEIGANEANGVLIREMGLYANDSGGAGTILLCRSTDVYVPKEPGVGRVLLWRIRF